MRAFRAVLGVGAALCLVTMASSPALATPATELPPSAREDLSARTATSATYALRDGSKATVVSTRQVNYRDGRGWRRIDDGLRKDGDGGVINGAGPLDVRLPPRLATPVVVRRGGATLKMRLLDADGATRVQLRDDSVRYDDVRPGVDLAYAMSGGTLKETLEVAGEDVPTVYRFALDASGDLRFDARVDRSIDVIDADGTTIFKIPAPVMWGRDAGQATARAVPYSLERVKGATRLVLRPDAGWLRATAADGGVVIDPTVTQNYMTGVTACSIVSDDTGASCGDGAGFVGWFGRVEWRLLMRFRLPEELAGMRVTGATFDSPAASTVTRGTFTARAISMRWDPECVRWTVAEATAYDDSICYFPTATWTGGATRAHGERTIDTFASYGLGGDLSTMTQDWIDDPASNFGVMIAGTNNTANASLYATPGESSTGSSLTIYYRPDVGRPAGHAIDSRRLTDRLSLARDLGTGNLLLEGADVQVQSRGLPFVLTRTYNSMSSRVGTFGKGTTTNLGLEQRVVVTAATAANNGAIVSFVDPSGREISFRPETNVAGATHYLSLTPDYSGDLSRLSDGTWRLVQRDGERSTFDSGGYLTTVADKDGNATQIGYSLSPKRPQTLTDSQGRDYALSYNGDGTLASVVDETSRMWRYGYGAVGGYPLLTSTTDPAGAITTYTWNGALCIGRVVTPEGRTTRIACDADGRATAITAVTDARADSGDTSSLGLTWDYACTACRTTSTFTDERGYRWTYSLGVAGRPTLITAPVGPSETRTYNVAGQLVTSTIGGARWLTSYAVSDPFLPVGRYDPLNVRTTTGYDSAHPNDPASEVDELGKTTTFSYADSSGTSTAGRLTTASVSGLGAVYQYAYNGFGQLRSVTTGAGNAVVDYGYDNDGQMTSVTYPNPRGTQRMSYDALSRRRTSTDAEGRSQTATYDALDRVLTESYSDGSSIAYEYDGDGNTTKRTVTPPVGTPEVTSWRYDAKGRPTLQTWVDGSTTQYGYDATNNLVRLTDDGGTVTYGYDNANRLTSITEPPLRGAAQVTQFSYDGYGNRSTVQTPNGVQLLYTFNAAGRQTALSLAPTAGGTPLVTRGYTYDNPDVNAPQRVTSHVFGETNESGELTTYSYDDPLARLVRATTLDRSNVQIGSLGYAYDARGNITRRTENGVATFLGSDGASLLTGTGAAAGSWSTTFGWDASGFLRSSTAGLSIGYNAKRQTTTLQPDGASSATSLGYAGGDQTQPTRVDAATIVYDELGAAKRTTPSGTTHYTRTPDGQVIGERLAAERLFPARDRQGSVLGVTDASGRLVRKLRYDPYGRTKLDTGAGQTTYGYAGGERFADGKVVRFGERFYSPELMRWTQPDPLDQPNSLTEANPFAYAAGDPINNTDPEGRCVWKIPCPKVVKWVWKKFAVSCLVYRSVIVRYQLNRDGYGMQQYVPVRRWMPILETCFEYGWVKP